MVLFDDLSSDEEFDMDDDEHIVIIVLLHKSQRPKHGGSVFSVKDPKALN
jgi:hypothetical protein